MDDVTKLIHSANVTILRVFENRDRIPITPGFLLMAAYIQFLFPQESQVEDYTTYNLDTTIFDTKDKWTKTNKDEKLGSAALFWRIRNAIAHAHIEFAGEEAVDLFDGDPRTRPFREDFRARVSMEAFGKFLTEITVQWMKRKVKSSEAADIAVRDC